VGLLGLKAVACAKHCKALCVHISWHGVLHPAAAAAAAVAAVRLQAFQKLLEIEDILERL
jgi:hypothetical protein